MQEIQIPTPPIVVLSRLETLINEIKIFGWFNGLINVCLFAPAADAERRTHDIVSRLHTFSAFSLSWIGFLIVRSFQKQNFTPCQLPRDRTSNASAMRMLTLSYGKVVGRHWEKVFATKIFSFIVRQVLLFLMARDGWRTLAKVLDEVVHLGHIVTVKVSWRH